MRHFNLRTVAVSTVLSAMTTWSVLADDTELFILDFSAGGASAGKVLLIMDTSGSMGWNITTKEGYNQDADGNVDYQNYEESISSQNALDNDFIYFVVDGVDGPGYVPSGNNEDRRFLWDINNCAASYEALSKNGVFTGYFREHRYHGNTGSWDDVRLNNGANYTVIDCINDYDLETDADGNLLKDGLPYSFTVKLQNDAGEFYDKLVDTINPGRYRVNNNNYADAEQGFPINGASKNADDFYTLDKDLAESTTRDSFDDGYLITMYTANYLRWYHYSEDTVVRSRMEVAREALANALSTISGVDFGMMMFNNNSSNGSNDGGRVIQALSSDTTSADMITTANSLPTDGWTPLSETLLEAKRYLGGEAIVYGNNDTSSNPKADKDAESGNDYLSPFGNTCDDVVNIIYVTDGTPTRDTHADSTIKALPINTDGVSGCAADASTVSDCSWGGSTSFGGGSTYLPALTSWMYTNDVNANLAGRQYAKTSTIGFGEDVLSGGSAMLTTAATQGGGSFYAAEDGVQLEQAIRQALIAVYEETSSLVSPAVTSNNFDRTQTLNRVYYAMFKPSLNQRWSGNLKKLELSPNGYMADQFGKPAISDDGSIIGEATTFWSSTKDGNDVELGGVREMLSAKSSRNVLFDLNASGLLSEFTQSNLESKAGSTALLADHLGVSESDLSDHLDWIVGSDVDDDDSDDSTTIRPDIMGDPLHSRPLVINFGLKSGAASDSTDPDDMDIRILVGTNGGAMHMFADNGDTVDESWAFMPYSLLARQQQRRRNEQSTNHIYTVDGTPTVFLLDKDGDGKYLSAGDKVLVFFGLRRGGDAYYGLDITTPDSPKLLWKIDSSSTGFSELGQTWSMPVTGYVPGYADPVVIFAAGYDINQDATTPNAADSRGRGVFIVNAYTGALVWSLTNNDDTRLTHSIPAAVATLDSNSDGAIDRLYFGDTGGRAWRVDLYSSDKEKWALSALADISDATQVTERRKFFTQPVVVRTFLRKLSEVTTGSGESQVTVVDSQQVPFDAVLMGTGDRSKPVTDKGSDGVNNYFFMFRDYNVSSMDVASLSNAPQAITIDELYDITNDPIGSASTEAAQQTQLIALGAAKGWVHGLAGDGEKSLGSALVLAGDVYFTSFLPGAVDSANCSIPSIGTGRTYLVNMHTGTSIHQQRYFEVLNKVPDDLIIHSGEDASGESVIRVFGGDPGEDLVYDDEDPDQEHGCEQQGECKEGSRVDDMNMRPQQIYFYFEEG
ncbi:pilus assembly protein [Aliagarivorans taiwanensis]|uniref:pilus assembly protein n=1 Tax=Aliagarivorans taiwanensis TaxID=561966 RepID=UPI000A003FF0|nr:PilC/PilY family type IV pilus protein [Aliagarivorans taiwanensis]